MRTSEVHLFAFVSHSLPTRTTRGCSELVNRAASSLTLVSPKGTHDVLVCSSIEQDPAAIANDMAVADHHAVGSALFVA